MLRLVATAAIGALSAAAAAQGVLVLDHVAQGATLRPAQSAMPVQEQLAQVTPASALPPAVGGDAQVTKAADGHYWAQAQVNGVDVRFLVDTGASAVALTPDDARKLGFVPENLGYTYQVTTANGVARAARIKLDDVSVAGAEVRDVDAYVIENGLSTSLLGMSYLGRLSRFEATPTELVLRP
jgi:aspartyl protease family protein